MRSKHPFGPGTSPSGPRSPRRRPARRPQPRSRRATAPPRAFAIEAELGARLFESDAAIAEPRLSTAAGAWIQHFGIFLSLSGGPGSPVSRAGLSGTFFDFGASLAARARFSTGRIA